MDPLPPRRWNPGFVEKRWRHVFWILPLIGIAVGLLMGALDFKRKNVATGVVEIRLVPGVKSSDAIAAFKSNDVIEATSQDLDLPRRWKTTQEESSRNLRRLIRTNSDHNTGLIEVSIVGARTSETVEICSTVVENTASLLNERATRMNLSRLESLKETVATLEARVEEKRIRLSSLIKHGPSVNDTPTPVPNLDFIQWQTEFSEAQLALTEAKIAQVAQEMQERFEANPIVVQRWPDLSDRPSIMDVLRPLLLYAGIGLAAGVGSTAIAAYLLEAAFPRKMMPEPALAG